ncbi:hypothetical protein COLO4_10480 [Corchorus olitorius]|uniref:Protein kinase domain-containing protein n=1 Tax=Corchorus olitorius TaxID=93759 RepID=A0A1R3K8F2_9ROSI|nr:hypothetical protein COLO4_10480 [Corchorus olitorius]
MIACLKVKRHDKDEIEDGQTIFIKNGGALLEELIAFCNGRSNPIRHFSAKELSKATNNYDRRQMLVYDFGYKLYKGSLRDCSIIVKKYHDSSLPEFAVQPYKGIAVGSQMSAHRNVLKVLGCCLETKQPTVVYESGGTKTLYTCISTTNVESIPWKCRLKIARDLASAVAYLHTAFSRPVIHRDIRSSNVILDQNNVPKLIDFGLCISIPEGESHVEDAVLGRTGHLAPEYAARGYLTEKVDVYQFGMLLFELLNGSGPLFCFIEGKFVAIDNLNLDKLSNLVYNRIKNEGIEQEQLLDFETFSLDASPLTTKRGQQ